MKQLSTKVVIVGGGLTGLTVGYYLKQAGIPFIIVEKEAHAGGVIQTVTEDGFTYETGPNTGVLNNEEIMSLFGSLTGRCTLSVARKEANKRYVLYENHWQALPAGLMQGIATPLFTWHDKIRLLGEPFRKRGSNPNESLSDLVKRRMGKSFLDYAVDPFVSGIYAGDPARLIPRHALPKLYCLEQDYGSFIGGAIRKMKAQKGQPQKFSKEVFSCQCGLHALPQAMYEAIGRDSVMLDCRQVRVDKGADGFTTTLHCGDEPVTIFSDRVVMAANAPTLTEVLSFMPQALTDSVAEMVYAPVVLAVAGFRRWTGMSLDAFGGLIPSKANKKVLGVLFPSAIFSDRAPEGGALLSVFLGGIRHPGLVGESDEAIRQLVVDELKQMMEMEACEPDLLRIFRHEKAIPQYDNSMDGRLALIGQLELSYPGLIVGGNIKDGIGMADRVRQGVHIAERIISES
ncbi:MAG: protoporphyrinogen oxidase [Breznakibacter sp.]